MIRMNANVAAYITRRKKRGAFHLDSPRGLLSIVSGERSVVLNRGYRWSPAIAKSRHGDISLQS